MKKFYDLFPVHTPSILSTRMAVLGVCWFTVDHFVSSDERPKCCVPFIEQGLVGKSHWDQTRDHNFPAIF
jgi:hypothetical protein